MLVQIAVSSLLARKFTVLLTIISITVSFSVLLGINHIKSEVRQSFGRTVSGVDLIVGGRTSSINLLLYSVFRIGNATNSINWDSYQQISQAKGIKWSIPISLGDSHRGYRVMGTTNDYFTYYQFGNKQALEFRAGSRFEHLYDVVLGAGVANSLNYQLGQQLVIAHGVGSTSFKQHKGFGFKVTGILKATGTPVDQTIHVTLPAIDAIHGGEVHHHGHEHEAHGHEHDAHEHDHDAHEHEHEAHGHEHEAHEHEHEAHGHEHEAHEHEHEAHEHDEGNHVGHEELHKSNPALNDISVESKQITAFMLGLNSKLASLSQLRAINEFKGEPLLAIMPGLALSELWQMMKMVEKTLSIIAFLVLIAALFGLTTMLLASMRERQREIAVLRAAGASAGFIIALIELEAILIVLLGMLLGYLGLISVLAMGQAMLAEKYGLFVSSVPQMDTTLIFVSIVVGMTFLLALVPAIISYRKSMINGLSVEV